MIIENNIFFVLFILEENGGNRFDFNMYDTSYTCNVYIAWNGEY